MSYFTTTHWLPHTPYHCSDVIMSAMASKITSFTIVYSTVYSGAHHRKHLSSASLAFVREWPVNSPQKGPVTRKMLPFDDVTMTTYWRIESVNKFVSFTLSSVTHHRAIWFSNLSTHPLRNILIFYQCNQHREASWFWEDEKLRDTGFWDPFTNMDSTQTQHG